VSGIILTLEWVVDAVGGVLRTGLPHREVGEVSIDSRSLQPGDLFVALRGSRFDGHAFVADARERGGVGAIVERGFRWPSAPGTGGVDDSPQGPARPAPADDGRRRQDFALIEVGDTLRALQDAAHVLRRIAGARVIAITGSAGKTTTKEAIAAFLGVRFASSRTRAISTTTSACRCR
jgi:UDP-N-acetylmuramoyl-tripeptide--D-alanyl-D-alanine ligase